MNGLISEAFAIMVTGMVTVFVFLTILIGAMNVLRIIADKPDADGEPGSAAASSPTAQQLAAITAAVHQHRRATNPQNNK
ncbi:OadG family protein [Pseudidiomarina woesei]|uniref:Probable oxaloacetate decarboxylase gamma chain n=1 Tax=Pseudidiomarina woesei TaxID=1381080 RepID=A0A0K6H1H0_9GAMM|nr:OadG family transporter subunit [Pseudidiomarina woesei]CUA84579.1 sodium pump decarboxylases, gamma subunit [Pseudidiomarina woesei]